MSISETDFKGRSVNNTAANVLLDNPWLGVSAKCFCSLYRILALVRCFREKEREKETTQF